MEPELEPNMPLDIGKYLTHMKKRIRAESSFDTLKKLKEELLAYYSSQELPPSALLERYRRLSFRSKLPMALHLALLAAAAVTVFQHLLFPAGPLDAVAVAVALAVGAVLAWGRSAQFFCGNRPDLWAFEMEIIKAKLREEHHYYVIPTIQAHWQGDRLVYQEPDGAE